MFGAALTEVFHQIFVPFMYKFTPTVNFCGSAEAVKKSTLIKLGGWKTGSFTEDIEYTMRVYKSGYRIQYIHDLPCEMEVPYNAKDLCKQQMRWAFGVIYAIKEHWWDIMKAKISWRTKMNIFVHASGYCLSSLIFFLFLFGSLSFITHPPGPIDLSLFIKETITNIVLTSGFLITLAVALVRSGRWKKIFAAIPTALSLGLLVTFYVNKGIIKVFTDKKMDWYLMKKTGRQGA